jgi:hypothetical protein
LTTYWEKCIFGAVLQTSKVTVMNAKNENGKDAWWVILLKVLAYAIGLIIGGIGTVQAAVLCAGI